MVPSNDAKLSKLFAVLLQRIQVALMMNDAAPTNVVVGSRSLFPSARNATTTRRARAPALQPKPRKRPSASSSSWLRGSVSGFLADSKLHLSCDHSDCVEAFHCASCPDSRSVRHWTSSNTAVMSQDAPLPFVYQESLPLTCR